MHQTEWNLLFFSESYFGFGRLLCMELLIPSGDRICDESLSYFHSLKLDGHRDAWTSVILLLFTQLQNLPDDKVISRQYRFDQIVIEGLFQFAKHVGVHYPHFCDLVALDLKPELRNVLRRVLVRIGVRFSVVATST